MLEPWGSPCIVFRSFEAPENRLTTDAVKLYRNEIIKVRCRFSEPMNQDPIPFCNRTSSRGAPMELRCSLCGHLSTLHISHCFVLTCSQLFLELRENISRLAGMKDNYICVRFQLWFIWFDVLWTSYLLFYFFLVYLLMPEGRHYGLRSENF